MKKFVIILSCLINLQLFAQIPQKINYQGVARDASGNIVTGAIGIKFEILQGSATGPVIYDETNNVIPGPSGIFTAGIGNGIAGVGTFSLINWSTGNKFLTVSIDPLGGTSYSTIGTSELLSVPYALYAATSGSGSSYLAGNGIAISSGSIINSAPNQTVNISGAGSATVSGVYPNFVVTTPGASTSAAVPGTISINPPHIVTNLGPNNNSITIQPTNISGSGVIGTYPNYTINSGPNPIIIGTGATTVSTVGNSYTVTTPPVNLSYNPGSGILSYTPAVGSNTVNLNPNISFTNGTLTIGTSTTIIPGTGVWTRPSATAATLVNTNDNVGIGISTPPNRLYVLEAVNPAIAIVGKNSYTTTSNANAMGIWGEANNPNGTSAGVYGVHNGGGNGVTGISNTTTYSNTAGIYGYAIGSATSNVSIQADVANGNSIGVFVNSFPGHNGTALYSLKAGSAGNAGKFEINNAANTSPALLVTTSGTGAAVRASVATSTISALALELDNGHIKSVSTAAPVSFTTAVAGGFTIPGFAPTCIGTDVKGAVSFSTSATGFSPINSFDIQYNFQKAYSVPPIVVLTPTTDFKGLFYMLLSSSNTNFVIRIYRPNGASFPVSIGNTFFNFNYFIIE